MGMPKTDRRTYAVFLVERAKETEKARTRPMIIGPLWVFARVRD